ncbi:hypothetical protein [Microbispora catharanthi]|uniref:Uncharacterized protein n=1 Tax=Microbispora catharanthi TaxID=1712871 RepID=A0A5N6BXP7_9ACTN|nr:hypothetical protein [Microbispora catharanthi]KAB8185296.1 hypothetical protein FH610_010845 [Microbispora catharanthi]
MAADVDALTMPDRCRSGRVAKTHQPVGMPIWSRSRTVRSSERVCAAAVMGGRLERICDQLGQPLGKGPFCRVRQSQAVVGQGQQ